MRGLVLSPADGLDPGPEDLGLEGAFGKGEGEGDGDVGDPGPENTLMELRAMSAGS